MPSGYSNFPKDKLYVLETELLEKKGINIFRGANSSDSLTKEDLARVLYNHPVVEALGNSTGTSNQRFELNNAGFLIYDLQYLLLSSLAL